jgi:hypothetical protein
VGLFPLARRGIQRAQDAVAVGLERAHAECLGERKGLAVMGGGLVDVQGSAMRGDVAEEAQSIRLMAAFLVFTGVLKRPLSEC